MAKFKSDKGKIWDPVNKAAKEYVAKTLPKHSQAIKDEVNKLRSKAREEAQDTLELAEQTIQKLLKDGFKTVKEKKDA